MKKLSITESDFKKSVTYKKGVRIIVFMQMNILKNLKQLKATTGKCSGK